MNEQINEKNIYKLIRNIEPKKMLIYRNTFVFHWYWGTDYIISLKVHQNKWCTFFAN